MKGFWFHGLRLHERAVLGFRGRSEEAGGDGPAGPARPLRPAGSGVSAPLFCCFSDGPRLHLV